MSSGGSVYSACGKLLYSWIAAILLRYGFPITSLFGMWHAWHDCACEPEPYGRSPSTDSPVRKSLNAHSG
jgi:hypothetical protein